MALATIWPQAAFAQKSPLGGAAYARALDHLAGSRFAPAADEMEVAVRFEPRFALGWYVLASASRRAGQCDRAVAAYRRYAELRPTEPDPYFGIGLCLKQVGDDAGALVAFKRYVETDPRPASRAYVDIARKHITALTAGRAASAAKPPAALVEARQLRDQGQVEEALARMQAVVAADPKAAEAQADLAHLLISMRRARDAIAPLHAAVKLAPAMAPAWYDLGFALREDGQTGPAVAAYRRYVTLRPQDPDAQYGLGRTLVLLGRNDEALAAFRAYVALEKRSTERRWLKKAHSEITRLEAARSPVEGGHTAGSTVPVPLAAVKSTARTATARQTPVAPSTPTARPATLTTIAPATLTTAPPPATAPPLALPPASIAPGVPSPPAIQTPSASQARE